MFFIPAIKSRILKLQRQVDIDKESYYLCVYGSV